MMTEKRYIDRNSELIKACARGNRKAQFEVYRLYYKSMYNVSLRILGDSAEAEDAMQESFLRAFQKLDTYVGEVSFGAWLKKIVINKSLDVLKSRRAVISLDASYEQAEEVDSEGEAMYSDMNIETVKNAILDLPEGYRLVLSLYLIEGYDHDEIAGILGISSATSRTQYHRAKKKLVLKLKEIKAVS